MQCCMVLLYCISTAAYPLRPPSKFLLPRQPRTRWLHPLFFIDRAILAFRGSLTDFKRTATVLALTMVIATSLIIKSPHSASPFEIPLATLLSISSACSVFALSILETWTVGRRRSGLTSATCALLLVSIGGVTLAGLIAQGGLYDLKLTPLYGFTALFCLETKYKDMVYGTVISLFYSCSIFPILVLALWFTSLIVEWLALHLEESKPILHNHPRQPQGDLVNRLLRVRIIVSRIPTQTAFAIARLRRHAAVKALACFVAFSIMCSAVAITIALKLSLHFSDDSFDWTFGQVLAVGTWIPVSLEWWYIFLCELSIVPLSTINAICVRRICADHDVGLVGMKEGLDGRLPLEYDAVYTGDADSDGTAVRPRRYSC